MKERIEHSFKSAEKILIVGYSPTGGGHTGRTFSIIDTAIVNGHLKSGDTVVLHCPPIWEKMDRRDIDNLTTRLQRNGINVVLALADKTVYGYLDPKTGGSLDSEIVRRFATYPKLPPNKAHVADVGVLWAPGETHIQGLKPIESVYGDAEAHTINAISLVQTITDIVDRDKVYVLTDMDPYLQKAAKRAHLDPTHCLDQQNHAILLQTPSAEDESASSSEVNNEPSKAYLAKVLRSHGAISHISLGGRNTLQAVGELASKLGIVEATSKAAARTEAVKMLMKGTRAEISKKFTTDDASKGRVMWAGEKNPEEIADVVYVYAHKNTPAIAEHIRERLEKADPNYTNKLYVFCGKDAAPDGFNAMHLAYLAGGHGITTAGAGTTGEFAYLHDKSGDTSRLLMLPISGHAEQQANAENIVRRFDGFASSVHDLSALGAAIDQLVTGTGPYDLSTTSKSSSTMSAPDQSTMEVFLSAVRDRITYAEQACQILFSHAPTLASESVNIKQLEDQLEKDPRNVIERRYAKLLFQVLDFLNTPQQEDGKALIYFKRGTPPVELTTQQLCTLFSSDEHLIAFLDPKGMDLSSWLADVPRRLEALPVASLEPTATSEATEHPKGISSSRESPKSSSAERALIAREETLACIEKFKDLKQSLSDSLKSELAEKAGRGFTTGF